MVRIKEVRTMGGMMSRKEAAQRLGVSLETLDQLRRQGYLTYVQHCKGGKVWISEAAIAEYIARITHPATPLRPVVDTYRKRRA